MVFTIFLIPSLNRYEFKFPIINSGIKFIFNDAKILELAIEGNTSAMIGTILRDKYGVPNVRLVMGERISQILERKERVPEIPEDLMSLMRRALRLIDHLSSNKKDLHNRRQLELCESKIRRLSRYYKEENKLSSDWTYKRDQLRLMVE